jgi:hypothetical protein
MRAEIQTIAGEIEKSLSLLAQRMEWDTASHRLEEFNARVEDPTLSMPSQVMRRSDKSCRIMSS